MGKIVFLLPAFFTPNAPGQSTFFAVEDYRLKKMDVAGLEIMPNPVENELVINPRLVCKTYR